MKCHNPNCKKKVTDEGNYCPYCGIPLKLNRGQIKVLRGFRKKLEDRHSRPFSLREAYEVMEALKKGFEDGVTQSMAEHVQEEKPDTAS